MSLHQLHDPESITSCPVQLHQLHDPRIDYMLSVDAAAAAVNAVSPSAISAREASSHFSVEFILQDNIPARRSGGSQHEVLAKLKLSCADGDWDVEDEQCLESLC